MTYKAFFDRSRHTVDGFFTLQDKNGNKLFSRLPARSGQKGFTSTDWVRGKSPIPMGEFKLWLKPLNPGQLAGKSGIGEFYPISNQDENRRLIKGIGTQQRLDIGLHPENSYVGSAGCIVLLNDTPSRKAEMLRLFAFLKTLSESDNHIELVVL